MDMRRRFIHVKMSGKYPQIWISFLEPPIVLIQSQLGLFTDLGGVLSHSDRFENLVRPLSRRVDYSYSTVAGGLEVIS